MCHCEEGSDEAISPLHGRGTCDIGYEVSSREHFAQVVRGFGFRVLAGCDGCFVSTATAEILQPELDGLCPDPEDAFVVRDAL